MGKSTSPRDLIRDEDTSISVFIREADRQRAVDVVERFSERIKP